jgi:hypothetical protein
MVVAVAELSYLLAAAVLAEAATAAAAAAGGAAGDNMSNVGKTQSDTHFSLTLVNHYASSGISICSRISQHVHAYHNMLSLLMLFH